MAFLPRSRLLAYDAYMAAIWNTTKIAFKAMDVLPMTYIHFTLITVSCCQLLLAGILMDAKNGSNCASLPIFHLNSVYIISSKTL
jgi:hypothetical protein